MGGVIFGISLISSKIIFGSTSTIVLMFTNLVIMIIIACNNIAVIKDNIIVLLVI